MLSSAMDATTVHCVTWFYQNGAAEMERGCFLEAAISFELGLSYLSFGLLPDITSSLLVVAATSHHDNACAGESHGHYVRSDDYFIFGTALELNTLNERLLEFSETDFLTHKAAAMLNLSISLHQAGMETGIQALISEAKASYQATLQLLNAIDQVQAIRIGVYALQNLAVLHYMQFEYGDCSQCLQSLYQIVQLGIDASILDEAVLNRVTMAMFFYAQPPTTAGCA